MAAAPLLLLALTASAAEPPLDPERPGRQRVVLGLSGVGGMAATAAWFFIAGDSLGAGDPASLIGGAGFIAAAGAVVGAATAHIAPDEADLEGEASTPVVRMGLGLPGAAWAREKNASTAFIDIRPRLNVSRLRITPGLMVTQQLGRARDVDWRDQPSGAFETSLERRSRGIDLDIEFRTRVVDDLDLIGTPLLMTRWEGFEYADGSERSLRRSMVVPLAAGFRWRISGRQYFESIAGPRWDQLAWGGDAGEGSAPAFYSQLFLVARYRIQLAHPDVLGGLVRSRVGLTYTHSNFDGQGYNIGAVIGFMGPWGFDYDVRWTPPRGPAIQGGFNWVVGDHGGIGFDVGLAPRGSRP